jgi:hypothetical protein
MLLTYNGTAKNTQHTLVVGKKPNGKSQLKSAKESGRQRAIQTAPTNGLVYGAAFAFALAARAIHP